MDSDHTKTRGRLRNYTVIGFYTDTGLNYCCHFRAADASEAARAAFDCRDDISIVAVIRGTHDAEAPVSEYIANSPAGLD